MSDHGARSLLLAALALLAGGGLLWWLAGRPTGVEELAAAVAAAPAGEVVRVDDLVDHAWEELHVFPPYTPPHQVETAVGQRVGAVRGLVRDEVVLVVLTDLRGRVVAAGLVPRSPVDWLPVAGGGPYRPADAVFVVAPADGARELRPQQPEEISAAAGPRPPRPPG